MTNLTKIISDKKEKASKKMEQPLFVQETAVDTKADQEPENGRRYVVACRTIYRIHVTTAFFLLLTGLMIIIIGVIGSICLYMQYAADVQMHRFRTGWFSIPYDSANVASYNAEKLNQSRPNSADLADSDLFKKLNRANQLQAMDFLKERFEIDLENEHFEKIDVPDFRGGRQGRFIHDFNINKTGIIDIDGRSCFVMPLNRQRVLPPYNLYDLLRKMFNGYYEVDTEIVRETMEVVTPPITDLSSVGTYIARECQDLRTYMLRKVNPTVVKRSASGGVFAHFAGKNIIEFDILNLEEVCK